MKTYMYLRIICIAAISFNSIISMAQESNVDSFLRDHLMVYYVEDPSSDQYRLLDSNEITSGQLLFGGNPEMEIAQQLIREIFIPESGNEFQESVIEALRREDQPMALFIYFDRGPIDEASASANWTNCIENGRFTSCVTVEAGDEYAGIIHYGANQMNGDGFDMAKNRFLELLTNVVDGSSQVAGSSNISAQIINRARQLAHVPEGGFRVERQGRMARFDISVRRMQRLKALVHDPDVRRHITWTLNLFGNDTGSARQSREDIDLALILAIASRETGEQLPLARGERRLVSAGRDAHSRGESGLDWLYDRRNDFPSSIRSEIIRVEGNPDIPGRFKRECHPAYIREKHVLASFIVEMPARRQFFLNRFARVFSDSNGFSNEQRQELLGQMSLNARRAWIQAAFGSRFR